MMLSEILKIKHSLILAPMFMVTNTKMVEAALNAGATGVLAAHNYRHPEALRKAVRKLHDKKLRPFGVNLVLDFESEQFRGYLEVCKEERVDFIISSLGDPKMVVDACKPLGIKVFSDVINIQHATKAVERGVDALVAVTRDAGGHAGRLTAEELIYQLVSQFDVPVIAAGGVANHDEYKRMIALGASGVSVGTAFIATQECDVSDEYKQALINADKNDVLLTKRISGIPITVLKTPYITSIGERRSFLEKKLKRYKRLKHFMGNAMPIIGLERYKHHVVGPDYQKIFCAGPSVQHIHSVTSVADVVRRIVDEN
ncbi:MAG: nitronate monooxygenase [Salinivirgaceae bacterium]|nr:nitronate monooxygenase [Salinivirgaceae bacterium]